MRNSIRLLPALALVALTAATARAFVIDAHPRVYNDVPTSNLSFTTGPDYALIDDENISAPTGWANRHDAVISDGPTGEVFNNSDYWTLSADVTLDGTVSPRKEGGLRVNNGAGGDFLFILNTDGHEVVSFGGPGPFYNFRDHGVPNYNAGDTINMGINYCQDPGGSIDPGTGLIRNGVILWAGGVYSPFLPMYNLENGFLNNSQISMYGQFQNDANNPANFGKAFFRNVQFSRTDGSAIPEPGSLSLLAGGLLPLLGLRRRK
jgi:hypothetical protein